jgi:hypothetical protein
VIYPVPKVEADNLPFAGIVKHAQSIITFGWNACMLIRSGMAFRG